MTGERPTSSASAVRRQAHAYAIAIAGSGGSATAATAAITAAASIAATATAIASSVATGPPITTREAAVAPREHEATIAPPASSIAIATATTAVALVVVLIAAATTITIVVVIIIAAVACARRVDAAVQVRDARVPTLGARAAAVFQRFLRRWIFVPAPVVVPAADQRRREHDPQPLPIHEASSTTATRPH
jgi:hypothetical protein